MKLEIFGSWESYSNLSHEVYVVTAQCSEHCHRMKTLIHPETLDKARLIDYLWNTILKHTHVAFHEIHPEIET